jgi:hypothetical protein
VRRGWNFILDVGTQKQGRRFRRVKALRSRGHPLCPSSHCNVGWGLLALKLWNRLWKSRPVRDPRTFYMHTVRQATDVCSQVCNQWRVYRHDTKNYGSRLYGVVFTSLCSLLVCSVTTGTSRTGRPRLILETWNLKVLTVVVCLRPSRHWRLSIRLWQSALLEGRMPLRIVPPLYSIYRVHILQCYAITGNTKQNQFT